MAWKPSPPHTQQPERPLTQLSPKVRILPCPRYVARTDDGKENGEKRPSFRFERGSVNSYAMLSSSPSPGQLASMMRW
jgi:hypothetical protein